VIWTNTTRKNSQLAFASALGQLLLKKPRRCDADRQATEEIDEQKDSD
jgi:hypothetical protein